MEQFVATETLVIELLLVVSLVAIAVQRLRVPYTVALVLVGLVITFQQSLQFQLTPELILALFVPPLVFEAAFHIQVQQLRENLRVILALAVPGVLLTTVIVGIVVAVGLRLSLPAALMFGALIAATDPVAVVSLFRTLGAPKRLSALVEGESLFNDGTAIVIFNLALAAALPTALAQPSRPAWLQLVWVGVEFVRVAAGGIGIGLGLGWVTSKIIARVDNYLIETTLTTVLAFGSYLLAERLHVSGVLAVLGAGIVNGNLGPQGMSPTTRIVLSNFWEYLTFVANSLVFLLIGLAVNVPQFIAHIVPIAIAVLAVLVSRAIVVYGLTWLASRRPGEVPWSYRHILFWGGLRGALSLALVLSLPAVIPEREQLLVMTFGVVLFTLLVKGTTIGTLLRRLGLVETLTEADLEYERRHGLLMSSRAARQRLQRMHNDGLIPTATWEKLLPDLDRDLQGHLDAQRKLLEERPELQSRVLELARREALMAERAMLGTLQSNGVLSERVYNELLTELDLELEGQRECVDDAPLPGDRPEGGKKTSAAKPGPCAERWSRNRRP